MRAAGRLLRAGEVPSWHLPVSVTTSGTISTRKAPKERPFVSASQSSPCIESDDETSCRRDTETQTEFDVGLKPCLSYERIMKLYRRIFS